MSFRVMICVFALMLAPGPAGAQPEPASRVQAEALFVDAQKALSRGDDAGAESLLKDALSSDPAFTSAIWQLAQIYESRGELDYARELLIRGLRQDPGASWAREKLAQIEGSLARTILAEARGHMNSGKYDLAIPKLSAYLGLRPDDPAALVAMAQCHIEKGNPKTARQYIEKVRAIDPGNAGISSLAARMEKSSRSTPNPPKHPATRISSRPSLSTSTRMGEPYAVNGSFAEPKSACRSFVKSQSGWFITEFVARQSIHGSRIHSPDCASRRQRRSLARKRICGRSPAE